MKKISDVERTSISCEEQNYLFYISQNRKDLNSLFEHQKKLEAGFMKAFIVFCAIVGILAIAAFGGLSHYVPFYAGALNSKMIPRLPQTMQSFGPNNISYFYNYIASVLPILLGSLFILIIAIIGYVFVNRETKKLLKSLPIGMSESPPK